VLTLINNNSNKSGIQIFTKEFTVQIKKYDDSAANPLNYKLVARTIDFGILSVSKSTHPQSILEKNLLVLPSEEEEKHDGGENSSSKNAMSELRIIKMNVHYNQKYNQSPINLAHKIMQ